MPKLGTMLELERCPHCNVDKPSLHRQWNTDTTTYKGEARRYWGVYRCTRCGGLVLAASSSESDLEVSEVYPSTADVEESIPTNARAYLTQSLNSLHAPAGAVMLAASSVDAMLKAKNYLEGSLYARIEKAVEDNLITVEMAEWAHDIRLDANDQRHADQGSALPETDDARRCVDFALALAQFLFVLPARVKRGLAAAASNAAPASSEQQPGTQFVKQPHG
jgi:hypothetical protein